uniref:Putative RNA dependent RNA polymerase n=1 Tax=Oidiodendron maius splipalmivirus 1 TaxID=2769353 RepID=A0A7G9U7U9_9VIRU|nr:putative RNA dependent RNA polymerase [Oidiodendron maius splipalmivirus 1]
MLTDSAFYKIERSSLPNWETFYDGDFQSYYASDDSLDDELVACYEETRIKLGLIGSLGEYLIEDLGRDLHLIQSVVGDDEHTTTDSISLGPCLIGFGPVINGIKLSWKDTGISPYVGNYAEGWILVPPTAEASFESVNRRHARSGVPFTLDPVKLKLLSPVRKQSPLWENDLESKMNHLAEIASWTDKSWFTYDYHQMALILANVIFDFEDARSFPYLFKTEGGCGGCPPYGNLDTVYSALHFYTRGKSHRAILGVMTEATQVNLGALKPTETFFIRSSHLANMGDRVWLRYESAYRTLLEGGELTPGEVKLLLNTVEGQNLPDDLLALSTEVSPESYTVGSTISALRQDGYLMSELDVKSAYDAKERELALMGEKPIGVLKREQEENMVLFKGNHLKVLSQIADFSDPIKDYLRGKIGVLPSEPNIEFRDILYSYYRLRSESHSTYSSFFYTDTVRLFKTDEVDAYLGRAHHQLRQDFALTDSFPKWRKKFLEENTSERKRKNDIQRWLDSGPLDQLLSKPLPPGIGTDDARIARSIVDTVKSQHLDSFDAIVVLLFSGDRQLARTTAIMVQPWLNTRFILGQLDKAAYTAVCLEGVSEWHKLYSQGNILANGQPSIPIRGKTREVLYYNYLLKRRWWLPVEVIAQVLKSGTNYDFLRGSRSYVFHVEYDYPNMERGLDLIKYEARTNTIREYGGGYLERRTLQGFGRDTCWSHTPLDAIASWPDFTEREAKRYYRRPKYFKSNAVMAVDPLSPVTYNRVDQWRRNTFPGILETVQSARAPAVTG